jgi:D-3-phosphoglycerate dehydrogenase / 2-oxoglutarate reductase
MSVRKKILLTDYAWDDLAPERARIEAAGHVLLNFHKAHPPAATITALCAEHRPQALMTVWGIVDAQAIAHCENLEIVARVGVGLDNIDRRAAAACGARVTNVPDYCMEEMSDHAIALLLSWARRTVENDREVKCGSWDPSRGGPRRVRDLTVGIAGCGRIGRLAARKLSGFGCRVLAYSRTPAREVADVEWVDFETLLERSDAVIVLLPLSPETRHIFDARAFARMKRDSLLINVSRGPLVHNEDLIAALDAGRIGAAALDVVDGEPNPPAQVTGHPKIIVTPHIAFSSPASIAELRERAFGEVIRVLAGEAPHNPVPPPA